MRSKSVVICSGGLDSTVLLYSVIHELSEPHVISFDYGQRHVVEIGYAQGTCKKLGLEHKVIDLCDLQDLLPSALTFREEVPEGHYAEATMKRTIVPNRNAIMLSIAYGWALSLGASKVCAAMHSGDHAIYPDCRPEFFQALQGAFNIGSSWEVDPPQLSVPFINVPKSGIVRLGHTLNVPFAETWSCYKGLPKHCGRCGTCVERAEAFSIAQVPDPTDYADSEYWKTVVQSA